MTGTTHASSGDLPKNGLSVAQPSGWRRLMPDLRLALMGVLFWIVGSAIMVAPTYTRPDETLSLVVGDVAPEDILAPAALSYTSELQTGEAREAAAAAVEDIYDPPDTRIVRQQVTKARNVLNFVSSVRVDAFASQTQQVDDLLAIVDVPLDEDTAMILLALSDEQWGAIQVEVTRVIEEAMSAAVTDSHLEEVRSQVPRLVSVDLSVTEAELVALLAHPLVVPNALFNAEATQRARTAAREAVTPVVVSFVSGQKVVESGSLISALDYEALTGLGLLEPPPENNWQDPVSRVLAITVVLLVVIGYISRMEQRLLRQRRYLLLTELMVLVFLGVAAWLVPDSMVMGFLLPASSVAILISVMVGAQFALLVALLLGALVGVLSGGQLDLSLYMVLGSMMAVFSMGRAERVTAFFWAGLTASVVGAVVILVFRLPDPNTDATGLVTLLGAAFANGVLSTSITLVGALVLSHIFDVTTSLQLIELMRPDNPLLQDLLRSAPGTYQHSLQIANLTEQAAEAINANTLLCRVGALYHDIGKGKRPEFFIENLIQQESPHKQLDPHTSAQIILGHVVDGLEMARQARLPGSIKAAIAEHHGTLVAQYQYRQAVAAAGGDASLVDVREFTYAGPRPQSRETALLMLADACEAKSRADLPSTVEEIREIVGEIIRRRIEQGQLNESGLTLNEIEIIRESFVNTLKGAFHSRIKYPPSPDGE